ncbi:hypothetical protein MMC25_005566 [Agyrium rufum]|nr:hypothetical protein [Agyrium rufum]
MRANMKERLRAERERLVKVQQRNLRVFLEQPLQEISGSFGDLGTLFPILAGYAYKDVISLSSTLVFSGLANILTGLWFGIPLPVQPMKAIAAGALRYDGHYQLHRGDIASAGLFVAGVVGVLSFTGLLSACNKRIPIPIVKGIQVATGINLMFASASGLCSMEFILWVPWIVVLMYVQTHPRVPYALIIVVLACIGVAINSFLGHARIYRPELWHPNVETPSSEEFLRGMSMLGVGQVPLTLLNSIVAVTYLSSDLLAEVRPPSSTELGVSITLINLIGCWFGAMPICHGSGGLAAQYRFGARSGSSIIFLGLLKLLLGLFFAKHVGDFLGYFDRSILASLLVLAGLELVQVGESLNNEKARDFWVIQEADEGGDEQRSGAQNARREILREVSDEEKKRRWSVMLITVGINLATENAGIGFLAGVFLHLAYNFNVRWEARKARLREGQIRLGEEGSEPSIGPISGEVHDGR